MSKLPTRNVNSLPDIINVTLGCWLFLSPFFLSHFEEMTSSLNAYIVGATIAVMAAHAKEGFHSIVEVVVGLAAIWLVISPWALGFSTLTDLGTINAVITGLVGLAVAAWSALTYHDPIVPEAV